MYHFSGVMGPEVVKRIMQRDKKGRSLSPTASLPGVKSSSVCFSHRPPSQKGAFPVTRRASTRGGVFVCVPPTVPSNCVCGQTGSLGRTKSFFSESFGQLHVRVQTTRDLHLDVFGERLKLLDFLTFLLRSVHFLLFCHYLLNLIHQLLRETIFLFFSSLF